MTELTTEVPETGMRLRIDADRPFDRHAGDSVLRVLGYSPDGEAVFDAAYAEVTLEEAKVLAWLCRQTISPIPEMIDSIAQEVQAAFGSKLSGRDAHQIAQIVALTQRDMLQRWIPESKTQETTQRLAERFERAAARAESPMGTSGDISGSRRPGKNGG